MSGEEFLDIPKTDETQQSTPEENYFSRSNRPKSRRAARQFEPDAAS